MGRRIELTPGKPLGAKWVWCGLCAEQIPRDKMHAHDKETKHADLYGRYSRQMALDRVIPVVYDDLHYGLFDGSASALDNVLAGYQRIR